MGAASGSKSKYELEGWGLPPHDRLWRARRGGGVPISSISHSSLGRNEATSQKTVGANAAPPAQHPQWLFTSTFSFPSGISKPTMRATSGTQSWVIQGFPTLRVLEGMEGPSRA